MFCKSLLAILLVVSCVSAHATNNSGDKSFAPFWADEDNLPQMTFSAISASTTSHYVNKRLPDSSFRSGVGYKRWSTNTGKIVTGADLRSSSDHDAVFRPTPACDLPRAIMHGSFNAGTANDGGMFTVDTSLSGSDLVEDTSAILLTNDTSAVFTTAAVPEPENYAMFLAGLGLMGVIASRRTR